MCYNRRSIAKAWTMNLFHTSLTLASIVIFGWLGRFLALKRNRHPLGWGLAGALFPPLLIILFVLKPLPEEAEEAEAAEA
jgi:hypothetical protein